MKADSSKYRRAVVSTTWAKDVSSTAHKIGPKPVDGLESSDFLARKETFGSLLLGRSEEAGHGQQKRAQRLGESGCVMVL